MTTNNHPAHGPLSLDRLHHIREILSKASAQSDGGNLGYAMADAVKVIDGAIAAFGAEPVGTFKKGPCGYYSSFHEDAVPLYTAPPAPVVPDERYQHLSELYHSQEKRLFKLAQRIKGPAFDKYAHSPSQAIDVLESALFVESDDDGRAAMLQGKSELPAYEIKRFGDFSARSFGLEIGQLTTSIQLFHFDRGTTPEPKHRGAFVYKYALQAIINTLQQQCDELSDTAVTVIWPAAPQQEVN